MGIVNRTKDTSEQKDIVQAVFGLVSTGVTLPVFVAPQACTVETVRVAAAGLSAVPVWSFFKMRGVTPEALGLTGMLLQNFGVSGAQGFSLLAVPGSTVLALGQGDVLFISTAGANTAAANAVVDIVYKKSQDILTWNGV